MPRAPPILTLTVGQAFQSSLSNHNPLFTESCEPATLRATHIQQGPSFTREAGSTLGICALPGPHPLCLWTPSRHLPFICAFTGTVSSTTGPLLSYLQGNSSCSSFSLTVALRLGPPTGIPRPGTQAPVDELDHHLSLASFRPQIKSRSGQTPAWSFACTEHDLQVTHLI